MCGRFTYKLTWPEIVKLYRLSLDTPARNPQARYNICPTTTIDTVIGRKGLRALVPMRWGVIPSWWSKPLKEMNLATLQRACGDHHREADVQTRLQAHALPNSSLGVL